jgi:hypothetical protein
MSSLRLAAPLLGTLLAACAFHTNGLGGAGSSSAGPGGGGGSTSVSASSASASTGTGGAGGCTGNPSMCGVVPAGWQRIGFAESPSAPCPAGFTAQDAIESPAAAPCTCGACSQQPPACDQGSVATFYDTGNATCQKGGQAAANSNAGGCNGTNTSFGSHFSGTAPPPVGGSCTATAAPAPMAVTDTAVRICTSDVPACEAELCKGGGTFSECVVADGDQPCPAGPYTQKHLVGDAGPVTCGACTCTLSATCKGKLDYFTDGNCSMNALHLPVDGTCVAVGTGSTTYHSYEYTGTVDTISCNVSPTASATVDLTSKRTVCCK